MHPLAGGLEKWRFVCSQYDPVSNDAGTMELQHITNPTTAKSMSELRDKIAQWEDAMARHTVSYYEDGNARGRRWHPEKHFA